MYIVSFKLDKTKILASLASLCLVVAVICAVLPQKTSDVLSNNVDSVVKNTQDHIAFLGSFGYNVSDRPLRVQEIIIPSDFSSEYEKYNELQKLSGFDLSKYKNKRVKQYTYKVSDYNNTDEVVANIIIYNDKVIGGDISSTAYGGFTHGLIKE